MTNNKERLFRPEYAGELFKIALSDLQSATLLNSTGVARPETILFHVQQCIEKSLKAVLCHLRIPIPLVHDIGALLGKIDEKQFPPHGYDLTDFNDYAGIRRYEEGEFEITQADIDAAIKMGSEVTKWAELLIHPEK